MLNRWVGSLFAFMLALGMAACSSNPVKLSHSALSTQISQLPDWLTHPTVKDGIGASDCVLASDNFGVDKSEVVAKGRADLAEQIQARVRAMEKTYHRKVKAHDNITTGSTFESVSKQVAEQNVSGAHAVKIKYLMINGKRNLCAMIAMDPKLTKALFTKIIKQSGNQPDPESKNAMYEDFKAYKAQQELDAATGGSNSN